LWCAGVGPGVLCFFFFLSKLSATPAPGLHGEVILYFPLSQ